MYLTRKILSLLILSLALPLTFYAQSKNFIYIQSERKQPFYVILNNKTNSSTPEGYLILPQIPQGKHLLTIGFPKNMFPEQQFLLEIKEDKGYSFKRTPSNVWQLFDLTSFVTINPVTNIDSALAETKKPYIIEEPKKENTAIVKEISKPIEAVKPVLESKKETPVVIEKPIETVAKKVDTIAVPVAIMEKKVVAETPLLEKKADTITSIKPSILIETKKDTVTIDKTTPVIEQKIVASVKPEVVKEKKEVTEIAIKRTELDIPIFVDTTGKKSDSILVNHKVDSIILVAAVIENKAVVEVAKKELISKHSSIKLILEKQQATGIDKIFTDSNEYGIDTIAVYIPLPAIPKTMKPATGATISSPVQSKVILTDEDFKKLRLTMASAAADDDMIALAVKTTNNKLVEVKQIKNLSTLFLNDDSKLRFFKAMKGSVKDLNNFPSLVSELSEAKNIAAFKTL